MVVTPNQAPIVVVSSVLVSLLSATTVIHSMIVVANIRALVNHSVVLLALLAKMVSAKAAQDHLQDHLQDLDHPLDQLPTAQGVKTSVLPLLAVVGVFLVITMATVLLATWEAPFHPHITATKVGTQVDTDRLHPCVYLSFPMTTCVVINSASMEKVLKHS